MKNNITIWGLSLLIILLGNCDIRELEEPIIIADLDDEFELTLWEELSPTNRSLSLLIETIKDEPCRNSEIVNSVFRSGSSFNVTLQDITTPTDCQTGIGPATARINLGFINPGVYNLDISLKNTVINEGQLSIRANRYLIQMKTENGIKFIRSELNAVPDSLYWGYVAYDSASLKTEAEEVMSQLGTFGDVVALANGDYGYFSVSQQKVSSILDQPANVYVLPFGWTKKASNAIQIADMERMKASLPEGMSLFLMDDSGRVY